MNLTIELPDELGAALSFYLPLHHKLHPVRLPKIIQQINLLRSSHLI